MNLFWGKETIEQKDLKPELDKCEAKASELYSQKRMNAVATGVGGVCILAGIFGMVAGALTTNGELALISILPVVGGGATLYAGIKDYKRAHTSLERLQNKISAIKNTISHNETWGKNYNSASAEEENSEK